MQPVLDAFQALLDAISPFYQPEYYLGAGFFVCFIMDLSIPAKWRARKLREAEAREVAAAKRKAKIADLLDNRETAIDYARLHGHTAKGALQIVNRVYPPR